MHCWRPFGSRATDFMDSAEFEKIEKQGEIAILRWIDQQMKGASVTVVLIGSETVNRRYVQYEIDQSWKNGMGLLGIHINALKDQFGKTKKNWGEENYLLRFSNVKTYKPRSFQEIRANIGNWIERAAQDAGR